MKDIVLLLAIYKIYNADAIVYRFIKCIVARIAFADLLLPFNCYSYM